MSVRAEIGHIAPLEGVRGLAVLWVVLFHYAVLRAGTGDPWLAALAHVPLANAVVHNGHLGVDLFFLLSGFLLTLPWHAHRAAGLPPPGARAFYRRRVRRIVPAYYAHLVLLFLLIVPLLRGFGWWQRDLYVIAGNAVAHALFLHNLTPLTSASFGVNGALWSLAVEAQFYALLPLAAPLLARRPWLATAAAFAIAAGWQWGARHGFDGAVRAILAAGALWQWPEAVARTLLKYQLPAYAAHFALGAALGGRWLAMRGAPFDRRLGIAALASALGLLAYLGTGIPPLGEHTWMPVTAALGILLYAAARGSSRFLSRGVLAFAGRVSYSAYLYHVPLLLLLVAGGFGASMPLGPAYALAVLAAAWLSWRFIEARSASAPRPTAPSRSPAPAAAPRPTAPASGGPHP